MSGDVSAWFLSIWRSQRLYGCPTADYRNSALRESLQNVFEYSKVMCSAVF